jgi:cation:H+ antiporter
MTLLQSIIVLVASFVGIILSANSLINNGNKIANLYKVSPFIIGVLILGFGTSAPEIFVSVFAAFGDAPELAVGNALGSNILNIALVLGVTAMILPITVNVKAIKKEWVFLIAYTLIAGGLLLWDRHLGVEDGYILLGLLVFFLWYIFKESKKVQHKADNLSSNVDISQKRTIWRNLLLSLIVLLGSAQFIVFAGKNIAISFQVSELIIGLTLIALGTSLPELAVAITSAIKKQNEMVVGNIIGSNLFNTVAVLAIPGLISPITVPEEIKIDYFYMLGLTIFLYLFFLTEPKPETNNKATYFSAKFFYDKKDTISRFEGFVLIIILSTYIYYRLLV